MAARVLIMGIPHCRQCAEYADSDKASEFANPIVGGFGHRDGNRSGRPVGPVACPDVRPKSISTHTGMLLARLPPLPC